MTNQDQEIFSSGDEKRLGALAEQSVRGAICRGRKRRADRPSCATGQIVVASKNALQTPALPAQPLKRRRTHLISNAAGSDGDDDGDSNDEWEEEVNVDDEAVDALSKSTNQVAVDKKHPGAAGAEASTSQLAGSSPNEGANSSHPSDSDVKARERLIAAAQRKKIVRKHSLHICLLIGHLRSLDASANSEDVRAVAMSFMQSDLQLGTGVTIERLSRLALWVRATFKMMAMCPELLKPTSSSKFQLLCSANERALRVASNRIGDIMDLLPVIAAFVRQQGVRCRILSALQLVPSRKPKAPRHTQSTPGKKQVVQVGCESNFQPVLYGWLEVWSESDGKWLPLDLFSGQVCTSFPGTVLRKSAEAIPCIQSAEHPPNEEEEKTIEDSPSKRRSYRTKSKSAARHLKERKLLNDSDAAQRSIAPSFFSHTVSTENGLVTDVTRRYSQSWAEVEKLRASGNLFEKNVRSLGRPVRSDEERATQRLELKEFDDISASESIPTTLSAIRKHPRYILERFLKKYEEIHPREPVVGHINDEPIFLRCNVHTLHTRDRWVRVMRVVSDDAVAIKAVRSKNGTDATVDLFGAWQTEALIIPPVINGKVPRGEHGNVDLWTPQHMPAGGEQVDVPYASVAARRLNVDYAPAMTGFELRRGRPVPKKEGVVVPVESAEAVRSAALELAAAAEQRAQDRAKAEALTRWTKLLRAVKARRKVRDKYGFMDDGMTYESMQKREGERRAFREKHGLPLENAQNEEREVRRAVHMKQEEDQDGKSNGRSCARVHDSVDATRGRY